MATGTLGSILLGTTDPDRLRRWYLEAFAPKENSNRFLDFGGFQMLIDGRDDLGPASPEPARVILNFHVDDARAVAAHLTSMGVRWLVELEERENGLFGTFTDPDGNYLQLIELNQDYLDAQS